MDLESARDFPEDSNWLFPIGSGDYYPGDKRERHSYECVPDYGDEEEGLGYMRGR